MDNLALAYVTCDKYDFVWEAWHDAFLKHWDVNIPMYFCGEEKSPEWGGWYDIPHEPVTADRWTTKLRNQVEQIEEDYIFVWLDDLIPQMDISYEFEMLYRYLQINNLDSLRIMMRGSAAQTYEVGSLLGRPIKKLTHDSPYLISYSPNIYKKQFLLDCLQWEESPWENEILGSIRIRSWLKNIYSYHIDGWCINSVIKGDDKRNSSI